MEVLKEKLDRRKWSKSKDFEQSYSNNMVTKDVEAYTNGDKLALATYTKVDGFSLEIYDKPDRGMVQTNFHQGGFSSLEEFEKFVGEVVENEDLN